MKVVVSNVVVIVYLLFLSGCASVSNMPLQTDSIEIDLSQKSVLVAKVTIKNENHPSFQPDMCCVLVKGKDEEFSFTEPTLLNDKGEEGKEFLISMDVEPGTIKLNTMRFWIHNLLMFAVAELPFDHDLNIPSGKLIYLGNIHATIKPKIDNDQPAAGGAFPLIDQAVAGFSNGTFDVNVTDQYDDYLKELHEKFPHTKDREIVNMVLPEWVHPEKRLTVNNKTASN
jgi:hypothetical protein